MKYAKEHYKWPLEKWRNIMWIDESKSVLYGGTGSRTFVRRPRNEEYRPIYAKKWSNTEVPALLYGSGFRIERKCAHELI